MSTHEIFPEELLDPNRLDEAIDFVRYFSIPYKYKKYAITDWCHETGVKLTQEIVERCGIPKSM